MTTQPVSWMKVQLDGGFWHQRQEINRKVTLPIEYQQCKVTGRIDAFRLNWKPGEPGQPHHFWDSDLAKWIEAVGYSLGTHPDAKLEKLCDGVIDLVASAQQADGYLNVFFTVVEPAKRWANLRDMHELYCAGHLMEAAVAYYQGTGKRKLVAVMCRYVEHIASVFGPSKGQKRGYCGHPEVELALMKLYRATGNETCLKLAEFFVLERGQSPSYFQVEADARGDGHVNQWGQRLEYFQADKPIIEQTTLEGHAVRALYLMCGAVDVAAATGNKRLLAACKRLWKNVTRKRMYITGGVGSARHNERFTYDYDLPNETAYAETCANIALTLFAHRLLQIEPSAEYADVMERALYNGVASGVSLSGDHFFYANPLTIDNEALTTDWEAISARRKAWFGCSCCPTNITRIYAWMGEMIYSSSQDAIFVHLYASSQTTVQLGGREVSLRQETRYPWDGKVKLTVRPAAGGNFAVALRIPGWCVGATIKVNGKTAKTAVVKGYARIERTWHAGDVVELNLPMAVQLIQTNPRCRNNIGKAAVQRGPIVYCAEEVDNPANLSAITLSAQARLATKFEPKLAGGVVTLSGPARALRDDNWDDQLYQGVGKMKTKPVRLQLVPYCVWGNRKVGRMRVWFSLA